MTGCQKLIDIDDENKLRNFYDKRMATEVEGDFLGDDFKGYIFRISGGNDKQGFPMMQGVLTNQRVRLLMRKGMPCYRQRRKGERKRKSVRGCIVSSELSVLCLVIIKKGENEIPGLTDTERPKRYGPKRANKIRKLFNLTKKDDVTKFVIKTKVTKKSGKTIEKSPKIQRLTTPVVLQRKMRVRRRKKRQFKKNQAEARVYNELLLKLQKDKMQAEKIAKMRKRSRSRLSSKRS